MRRRPTRSWRGARTTQLKCGALVRPVLIGYFDDSPPNGRFNAFQCHLQLVGHGARVLQNRDSTSATLHPCWWPSYKALQLTSVSLRLRRCSGARSRTPVVGRTSFRCTQLAACLPEIRHASVRPWRGWLLGKRVAQARRWTRDRDNMSSPIKKSSSHLQRAFLRAPAMFCNQARRDMSRRPWRLSRCSSFFRLALNA
jgi:hypothetical protein